MKTLIVEDDFLARALLSTLLSEYGPCHLVVDGEEAVAAIGNAYDKGEPYDLICLDIMMPIMDGQMALEKIREDENVRGVEKGVSVFMVTALDDEENKKKAEASGCQAYLTKPLNKKRVIEKLEEHKLI